MDTHYKSNRQKKIEERQALQLDTFFEKRKQEAEERWVNAQVKAAGFQSVLNYAVEQFNEHKEELETEMVTKTEEMITERQKEIETFLMSEKDKYLESIGIQAD
jgi:squalene cyclase